MHSRTPLFSVIVASLCLGQCAGAQTFAQPQARILQSVNEASSVTLTGNIHPMAMSTSLSSAADPGTPMDHMILYLKGDANQEAQLAQLIAQQNDPKSALYHHYLTPEDFGAQFGAATADIAKIKSWLQEQGFKIEETPAGNRSIVFSGNTSQVASAFKTEIRSFSVGGAKHLANTSNPQIPAALASTVGGIVKLHNFQHTAHIGKQTAVTAAQLANPEYNYGTGHYLSPADYATIYNINPLYKAGIDGTGQTIGVIARSNIYLSDVTTFRTQFGLKANNPQIVITNSDPGVLQGDSYETTLDTEWVGAIAPNATVKVIVAASTNADGIDLSSLYAVSHNVAPILSLSYGSCEASMGTSELAFYNSLWQQAAAQGQSVMVSSGDSGAAGCYGGSSSSGSGQAINGLCSSPYATCVGGTQFVEGSNAGQYWLPGNNPVYGSAISYIPETVWNESGSVTGGSGLWGGGGGASITYPKPLWQAGPGVPADGKRDVPDVSLSASGHDGYLIIASGGLNSVGGTSASAPSFAGLMALVNQKTNARQGLANTTLYPLAIKQAAGGAAVFHDTITGNNSVPGVTGFSATVGYDRASGLGSVDANAMVNNWTNTAVTDSLAVKGSATSLSVKAGQAASTVTVTTIPSVNLKTAVALTVSGAPTGMTASFVNSTIASPGAGSTTLNITAAGNTAPGTYTLAITATGGTITGSMTLTVEVVVPTFTLATNVSSVSSFTASSAQVAASVTPQNGFNAAVSLSVSGMPSGVTGSFSATTIAGSGGASTLTLSAAKTATAGSYPVTITATSSGITKTLAVTLVISTPPSCTLAASPSLANVNAGESINVQLACGSAQGAFSGPLSLAVAGAPSGMTAKLTPSTLTVGSATALQVSTVVTTTAGKYNLTLTASTTGYAQTITIPVTVAAASNFNLTASGSVSVKASSSTPVSVSTTLIGVFNSSIALSVSGLPTGVTASLSKSSIAAPGSGSSTVTFAINSSVKAGTYSVAINATGGGLTRSTTVTLTIPATQDFALVLSTNAITIAQGGKASVTSSTGNFTGGYNGQINMSFSGLAPGMNWGVTGATAANNMVNITYAFSAATYTPAGTYALMITATGVGGIVHSGVVTVTITTAANQTKN